jgi:hypothetical protein
MQREVLLVGRTNSAPHTDSFGCGCNAHDSALGIVSLEGYHCAMDCEECEDLNRRHALATEKYMEADRRRKAYVPGGPISGRDITELARLDQEVENTKGKRDDLAKEYARHRREAHPKGRTS